MQMCMFCILVKTFTIYMTAKQSITTYQTLMWTRVAPRLSVLTDQTLMWTRVAQRLSVLTDQTLI